MAELTALLISARQGDKEAAGKAFSQLYADLHRLARSKLRQHKSMTLLDTTSLVHESYLLVSAGIPVADRQPFFAYASRVMRSVIVDSLAHGWPSGVEETTFASIRDTTSLATVASQRSMCSACTKRSTSSRRRTNASPKSSRCATSAATPSRRSPKRWTRPSAPSAATGKRRRLMLFAALE